MKKKKITTIEGLATLVQGEFLRVHKRFDDLESEIKELRRDVDDLKLRMSEVAYHFEIREIEKRLDRLELKVGAR